MNQPDLPPTSGAETAPDASSAESPSPVQVRVHIGLTLPRGSQVKLKVTTAPGQLGIQPHVTIERTLSPKPHSRYSAIAAGLFRRMPSLAAFLRAHPIEIFLFGGALLVYLAVRLIGLPDYPIYFFTDEAVQTMSAVDLLKNYLRGADGHLLPTYFQNGVYYNLSLSVYLQVLPFLLFGKSVFATRATSVLVSILAALSVGLILRHHFKVRYWWAGALLLSMMPAWFLHSRTAFETVVFTVMYAAFLYAYLLYRCTSPRYIYLPLLFAGLAFYSYNPGQLIIGATGVLLLLIDLPYHWQQRHYWKRVLLILVALALPYLRFRLSSDFTPGDHLRLLDSYWVQDITLPEKLVHFWAEYSRGLSISYWFNPEQQDMARHTMKGYGNIQLFLLPFFLVGVVISVLNARKPAYRTVLVAALCAPLSSALVGIGITRVLVFVIPAALFTGLGLSSIFEWLPSLWQTRRVPQRLSADSFHSWAAWVLFIILVVSNGWLLRDALVNGPRWFTDYGLGGMQYGARQLFPAIDDYRRQHPGTQLIVSPNWANGTDVLARFFLSDQDGIALGSVDGHLFEQKPLDEKTVFVMLPDEYSRAMESGKFTDIQVDQTIPYPDGQPGFYFVRLRYVDNIAQILESERETRRQLQEIRLEIDGQPVKLGYSMLDMGIPELLFDGDRTSVVRTLEANPFVLDMQFDQPRGLNGLSVIIGRVDIQVTAWLYVSDQAPLEFFVLQRETDNLEELDLMFGQEYVVQRLKLMIAYPDRGEPEHVHVWEVILH